MFVVLGDWGIGFLSREQGSRGREEKNKKSLRVRPPHPYPSPIGRPPDNN
jgi:hypothetical protein